MVIDRAKEIVEQLSDNDIIEKVQSIVVDNRTDKKTPKKTYDEVDLEQIIRWDPDIIFLDPGNMDLVNDEYRNNPDFFQSLRAVREGKLYTMPSTNAAGPNITYLLINAYYAGIVLYPDQFADVVLEEKAGEIMEQMLGADFFQEMEEGGLYYGTIAIGG